MFKLSSPNSRTQKTGLQPTPKQRCLKREKKTWKRYLNAFAGILQETTHSRVTHKIVEFTNSRLMKEHFHDHANISIHAFTRKKRSIHEFTTWKRAIQAFTPTAGGASYTSAGYYSVIPPHDL